MFSIKRAIIVPCCVTGRCCRFIHSSAETSFDRNLSARLRRSFALIQTRENTQTVSSSISRPMFPEGEGGCCWCVSKVIYLFIYPFISLAPAKFTIGATAAEPQEASLCQAPPADRLDPKLHQFVCLYPNRE